MRKRLSVISMSLALALLAFVWAAEQGQAAPILNPAIDLSKPNYAYSPLLRKFVDSLPGLTSAGTNSLGQFIPIAVADTATYPGSDYYEIGLIEYREQLHSDLPPVTGTWPNQSGGTKLRAYVQLVNGYDHLCRTAPLSGTGDPCNEEQASTHQVHQPASSHRCRRRSFHPGGHHPYGRWHGALNVRRCYLVIPPHQVQPAPVIRRTAQPSISMAAFPRGSAMVRPTSGSRRPEKLPPT